MNVRLDLSLIETDFVEKFK